MRTLLCLLPVSVLVACGDPSEHYRPPLAPGGEPGMGAAPVQPPGGGAAPAEGTPPPNQGSAGAAPGLDGPCQATGLTVEQYGLEAGSGVKLEGDLLYAGEMSGLLLLDLVAVDSLGGANASAYSVVCSGVGAFEAEVPKDLGEARLVVFIDADGNGPSEGDPGGLSDELDIGGSSIEGITVHITDDPDLGAFAPENQVQAPAARPPSDDPDAEPTLMGDGAAPGEPAPGGEPGPAGEPSPGGGPVDDLAPAGASGAADPAGAPAPGAGAEPPPVDQPAPAEDANPQ